MGELEDHRILVVTEDPAGLATTSRTTWCASARTGRSPSRAAGSSTCRLRASCRRATLSTADAGGEVAHHAALGGDHELSARASLAGGPARASGSSPDEEAANLARFGAQHAAELPTAQRLPLQVALLGVLAYSNVWRTRGAELEAELVDKIGECEMAGLPAIAAAGFETLSLVQYEIGKLDSAMTSSLRSLRAARTRWPHWRAPRAWPAWPGA